MPELGTRNKKAPQRGCFCYAVWAGRDVLKSGVLHLQCFSRLTALPLGGWSVFEYIERYYNRVSKHSTMAESDLLSSNARIFSL